MVRGNLPRRRPPLQISGIEWYDFYIMQTGQKISPMMQQYQQAKAAGGDALLLFRMGDFYELFYDDAKIAADKLGLTLTSRDKGENAVPMAGFPHHQLDNYLANLIQQGFRVAVCEQVEDAAAAKGLVRRELTQVVSPGTVTDLELLDPKESNFLTAICAEPPKKSDRRKPTAVGLSWIDLSTGAFYAAVATEAELADFLARLAPSEILLAEDDALKLPAAGDRTVITRRPVWTFAKKHSLDSLTRQFRVSSLEGFGFSETEGPAIRAAGAILEYVRENQSGSLEFIDRLQPLVRDAVMQIDQATWRSLEITRTIRHHERTGSLFDVIDRTLTAMGSRLLVSWMRQPLTCPQSIARRQDAIAELIEQPPLRDSFRQYLKQVTDTQRLLARVANARATPRDLAGIGLTLATLPGLKSKLAGCRSELLCQLESDLDPCEDLHQLLHAALESECPITAKEGGFIRDAYNSQLDGYRELARGGKQWIAQYQAKVSHETGIPSLKVGYNKVFGYYIEVTHVHRDKVPDSFIRKQTLKNAERYITPELKEYEDQVVSAEQNAIDLEYELFCQIREQVRERMSELKRNSQVIAQLDVLCGLAELAVIHHYTRPSIVDAAVISIHAGRHPVLDITEPLGAFVPNDTKLGEENGVIHLITGPNMAGKSTYIRQVALIVLLSHIGSFVPAESATIGVTDRLFARVGASDELSRGQSTFMVEMTETARILNTATPRSLVILDEIGRGTSTYDGVSLAWAIVEYLHENIGARTMFATHYHELTKLEETFPAVRNYNVTVKEWNDEIVFLHKIAPGGADRSYGIHVAQLAGIPAWVNRRAEKILKQLERNGTEASDVDQAATRAGSEIQLTLFGATTHPLIEKIKRLDTDHVTPMSALAMIQQWKSELDDDETANNVTSDEMTDERR